MKTKMYKTALISFILLIVNNLYAQIEQSDCNAVDTIMNKYMETSAQLSVRRIYEVKSADTIFVKLKQENIDSILTALIAIYNVQNIPERDTVIDIYNISSRGPGINKVYIKADTTKSWTDNWKNLITLTGDSLIDTILTKYHLSIDYYSEYSGTASFTSDLFLNIKVLVDTIEQHPDVIYAGQNQGYLDGPDIYYTSQADTQFVKYKYAWGDCMSGCMCSRFWEFKVYNDCSVEFIKSYGCVIQSVDKIKSNKYISIYPNPAKDFVNIKVNNNELSKISVIDISGKILKTENFNNNLKIETKEFEKGIYIFKIETNNEVITKRIVID